MDERAEGFWWVRWRNGSRSWMVGQVVHGRLSAHGIHTTWPLDSEMIEWGPYLGKEPPRVVARDVREACGEVEVSVDGGMTWPIWLPGWQVERAVTMEAKRAAASPCAYEECGEMADVVYENGIGWCRKHRGLVGHFDPSTDYEGEQTRALDGSGVEVTMPSEDGGPPWTVRFDHKGAEPWNVEGGPFDYLTSLHAAVACGTCNGAEAVVDENGEDGPCPLCCSEVRG
jgi:hypothetical protein